MTKAFGTNPQPDTKIIWQNGAPVRVPSTLHADAAAGKFKNPGNRSSRLRQSHDDSPSHDHECAFCSWRGPYSHYYAHWRTNHRTRVGVTRRELEKARHAP